MKILYVTPSPVPSRRANCVQTLKMCEAFAGNGHNVNLLSPSESSISDEELISSFGLKTRFDRAPFNTGSRFKGGKFLLRLVRLLMRGDCDLVYTRMLPAALVARVMQKKSVLELHANVAQLPVIDRISYWLLTRVTGISRVVFISSALREIVEGEAGVSARTDGMVAHDGASAVSSPIFRRANGPLTIGYVGSLGTGKGFDIVIRLAEALPNDRFIVAGDPSTHAESGSVRVPDNIEMLGFLPHGQLHEVFSSMDVALLPNSNKIVTYGKGVDIAAYTSPMKMFEYMAHGIPIVASDIGVLREVLSVEFARFACPEDISTWVNALESLRDADERMSLGLAAKKCLEQQYSWNIRAERVLRGLV